MSANAEIARIFDEMAVVLELTGANPFRAVAFERAARALRDMTVDVAGIATREQLMEIDGIGEGTAGRILQFLETGRIKEHDDLLAKVPAGLLEVLEVPGLGPKTVRMLWEKAGVTSMDTLREKLEAGALDDLPRMGEKTIQNIRESIAFKGKSGRRMRLGEAMPLAEAIVSHLKAVKGARRVEYAGSLRRGRETVGDIDVLATTSDPAAMSEAFRGMPGVTKVLAAGETKSSVRLEPGVQVDLRVVDEGALGAALMYFTGSKEHNVKLRERAIRYRYKLNEYGLFPADAPDESPPVAARDEAGIYQALELPWIPPELREDQGELALQQTPRLIELADIKAELHAHTIASDGKMTIDELAEAAAARGFHTVAVTDHSVSSAMAGGLTPERLLRHIDAVREAAARHKKITLLVGSEVDIHPDGRLDYDDDLLAKLDVVVASPHASLRQDPETATRRLVAAASHPLVHVLGHPTGRMLNQREGLNPDMQAVIAAAVEHGTALEINAQSMRLDLRDAHVRAAVAAGALLAIDTDAHRPEHFDMLRYGILTARRGGLVPAQCINAWPRVRLQRWLKAKGRGKRTAARE